MTAPVLWPGGNRARLLESGEAYFPHVLAAIAEAARELLLETFILFEQQVGLELQRVLPEPARRARALVGGIDHSADPAHPPTVDMLEPPGVAERTR